MSDPRWPVTPYHRQVQTDPGDTLPPTPESREGEPASSSPAGGVTPPSGPPQPSPPRMPGSGELATAAGPGQAPPPPPPRMPGIDVVPSPSSREGPPPLVPVSPSDDSEGASGAPPTDSHPDLGIAATPSSVGEVTAHPDGAESEAESTVDPRPAARPSVAPVVTSPMEEDWLSSICPYLQSEDGAYRLNQPDHSHRCAAQDPPGLLPLAFQERFCLTDRYPRCEMYKYAQEVAGTGTDPVEPLLGATSVSVGGAALMTPRSPGSISSRRPALIAAAGIGGVAILVVVLVLLLGSCSGGSGTPGPTSDATSVPQGSSAATEATSRPKPTATPTSGPSMVPGSSGDATAPPLAAGSVILYEVQEGEALVKIAEAFGTSRRDIIRANDGMADKKPYVETGDVIRVPVSPDLSIEQIESSPPPGYQGPASP